MRTRARAVLIVAIGLAAFLPFGTTVQAQANFTDFTGTESCYPIYSGNWTFPDGNIQIRGMILNCTEVTTTPLMAGQNIVVMNANLRAEPGALLGGVGPFWGTWQMESWAGTWAGIMTADGGIYNAQGSGTGPYEGMKVSLRSDHEVLSGRILDPKGGK